MSKRGRNLMPGNEAALSCNYPQPLFNLTQVGIDQLHKYFAILEIIEMERSASLESASREEMASIDRQAMIFTLSVVQVILGVCDVVTAPITRLHYALNDVKDGKKLPTIFQSAKRRGKPPLNTITQLLRASVAAAVYRREQKIGDIDAAAKQVLAKMPNGIKLAVSDKVVTWQMLRQWRWEFASAPASEDPAKENYRSLISRSDIDDDQFPLF